MATEPKGHIPYFEDEKYLAEIDLRGRFMSMACDIEFSMIQILWWCNPVPTNRRIKQFEGMMMNEKVECVICDLKKVKPHLYKEYEPYLNMLQEFKDVCNDMAHYQMKFTDDTLYSFHLRYVAKECGELRIIPKPYDLPKVKDLINRFGLANLKFLEILMKLKDEHDSTIAEQA